MRRHKIVTGLNGKSVDHQPYYPQNADSFPAFLAPAGFFPFNSVILTSALKAKFSAVGILAGLLLLASATASAQDFNRTLSFRLAAIQAMRAAAELLGKLETQPFVDMASTEMLNNVKKFASSSTAQQIVQQKIEQELQARLDQQLTALYNGLNFSEHGMALDQLRSEINGTLGNAIGEAKSGFVSRNAGPVFAAARAAVVEAQTKVLANAAYPSADDVIRADRNGFTEAGQQELRRGIVAQIEHDLPEVFDEVDSKARNAADGVLKDLNEQRSMQFELAQAKFPDALVTSAQMSAHGIATAEAAIAAKRAGAPVGHQVYGLMPSARRKIEERAAAEEVSRLKAFAVNLQVPVQPEALRTVMSANLEKHSDRAVSEGVFTQQYFESALRLVLQKRLDQAADAPDLELYTARVMADFGDGGAARSDLLKAIKNSLAKPLLDTRKAIASEQLSAFFPDLAAQNWQAPELSIIAAQKNTLAIHDLDTVLSLTGITKGGRPLQRKALLAETQALAVEFAGRAMNESVNALNKQWALAK